MESHTQSPQISVFSRALRIKWVNHLAKEQRFLGAISVSPSNQKLHLTHSTPTITVGWGVLLMDFFFGEVGTLNVSEPMELADLDLSQRIFLLGVESLCKHPECDF